MHFSSSTLCSFIITDVSRCFFTNRLGLKGVWAVAIQDSNVNEQQTGNNASVWETNTLV